MNNSKLAIGVLVAICAFSLAWEAGARGGAGGGRGMGMGIRAQKRDGSCIRNSAVTRTQAQTGQQLRDGSGVGAGMARQGMGQGAQRRLGPGDGTGNAVRPLDGTGYGSPLK